MPLIGTAEFPQTARKEIGVNPLRLQSRFTADLSEPRLDLSAPSLIPADPRNQSLFFRDCYCPANLSVLLWTLSTGLARKIVTREIRPFFHYLFDSYIFFPFKTGLLLRLNVHVGPPWSMTWLSCFSSRTLNSSLTCTASQNLYESLFLIHAAQSVKSVVNQTSLLILISP